MKKMCIKILTLLCGMFSKMKTFLFSDCKDSNAKSMYFANFANNWINDVVISGINHPLEGAMTIVSLLKILRTGILYENWAPRREEDRTEGYENGRPFFYFWKKRFSWLPTWFPLFKGILVVASDETEIWGLLDYFGELPETVKVIDISKHPKSGTQFRSAQVLPDYISLIWWGFYHGEVIRPKKVSVRGRVLIVDNFGNCKFAIRYRDHDFFFAESNTAIVDSYHDIISQLLVPALSCVGKDEICITVGSSETREFVIGQGNFAKKFDVHVGDTEEDVIRKIIVFFKHFEKTPIQAKLGDDIADFAALLIKKLKSQRGIYQVTGEFNAGILIPVGCESTVESIVNYYHKELKKL